MAENLQQRQDLVKQLLKAPKIEWWGRNVLVFEAIRSANNQLFAKVIQKLEKQPAYRDERKKNWKQLARIPEVAAIYPKRRLYNIVACNEASTKFRVLKEGLLLTEEQILKQIAKHPEKMDSILNVVEFTLYYPKSREFFFKMIKHSVKHGKYRINPYVRTRPSPERWEQDRIFLAEKLIDAKKFIKHTRFGEK